MPYIHRLSRIYLPCYSPQNAKKSVSLSFQLLADQGFIQTQEGFSYFLPFIMRSVNKLNALVHSQMETISAQEILLPTLTPADLLQKTGRLDTPELFRLKDRNDKEYVLSPTHEEAITSLLAHETAIPFNKLPLRYYQISRKFRDETRYRCGLLRSREFIMKDLYCFDDSVESSEKTYKEVSDCYHKFFKSLKVPYVVVKGHAGDIGDGTSHEYHFLTEAGEDRLLLCKDCGFGVNLGQYEGDELTCEECKSKNVVKHQGLEVGHTFHLGKKYSEPFNCQFANETKKTSTLEMSCYGLGITRIIAGAVEILSKPKSKEIRWPLQIAPFSVYFIPPKENSKEDIAAGKLTHHVYSILNEHFKSDVLVDDRTDRTIGNRLRIGKSLGIPLIFVVGVKIKEDIPKVEVQNLYDGSESYVSVNELVDYIKNELLNRQKCEQGEESSKAVL